MKLADILHSLADNLERTETLAIQQPARSIKVEAENDENKTSPNGVTASGNDKSPEDLFVPPLQQKQELLKKAVGVENIYDDGDPSEQDNTTESSNKEDEVSKIKRMAGIPVAAIQELSNDNVIDD